MGEDSILGGAVLPLLCAQFYLEGVRSVSLSYTNACGLIVRDRIRPLIEGALNLAISLVALRYMGIAGVIVGTIASFVLTAFWREPLILYRYAFNVPVVNYWTDYLHHLAVTLLATFVFYRVKLAIFGVRMGPLAWIACGMVGALIFTTVLSLAFWRSAEFRYYRHLVVERTFRAFPHRST